MARTALYTLIFLIGAAVSTSTAPGTRVSKYDEDNAFFESTVAGQVMSSAVTVINDTGRKRIVLGGGVIVRARVGLPLQVLTVTHIASSLKPGHGYVTVVYGSIQVNMRVRIAFECDQRDLALLETTDTWTGPDIAARVADKSPRWGDRVWLVGAPAGEERTLAHGVLSNKVMCARSVGTCYKTDGELYFGSSGGGVFDQKGRLVGITDYVTVEYIEDSKGVRHPIIMGGGGGIISWNVLGRFLEEQGVR